MLHSPVFRAVFSFLAVLTLIPWVTSGAGSGAQQPGASEIVGLRTLNAKVFQRTNGSGYVQVFSYPVHYQDGFGGWAEIRPELIQLAGANTWANTAGDVAVQFQATSEVRTSVQSNLPTTPLVSLATATRSITFEPVGAQSVTGQVSGARITYPEIYNGVDLQYLNASNAVKENLIFRRLPDQTAFTFVLRVLGAVPQLEANGGITLAPCGETCWSILPPYMEDASGATTDAVTTTLENVGDGTYALTYTPDAAWLTDAKRVYPVVLDPTVDTRGGGDTLYTQQGYPTIAGYQQRYLSLGYDPENNGKAITRAFFYAAMPQIPAGSTIDSAVLNMYQYYAPNTTGYNTVVYNVTTAWQTSPVSYPWNNSPSVDGTVITTANVSSALGWKTWDVTSLAQQWYSGVANNGVAIYANPESSPGAYFCSSHALGTQCSLSTDALQLRPYFVVNYTTPGPGPGPTYTPTPTATPTITPTPYVPPTAPQLTISPTSVDLNINATVRLEGVPPGHRVRLSSSRGSADSFGATFGNADAVGRFSTTVRSGNAGSATITARNETTGQTLATSAQISFKSAPPAPRPAVITGVKTTYPLDARYLQGIPVNNPINVTIDWKGGSAGRAALIINGRTIAMRLSGNTASATINMGSDLANGRTALRVAVYNAANQLTDQRDYAPWSTPLPIWLSGLIAAGPVGPMVFGGSFNGAYETERNFKIPGGSFKLGIPGVKDHNSELGFFAGGTVKYPINCSAPFEMKARVGTEMNIEFTDIMLGGQVKVSGDIKSEAVCVIQTARGKIEVEVKVYGRQDWSVLALVADFFAPGAGTGIREIERKAGIRLLGVLYLQAGMAGSLGSDVRTINTRPFLEWSNIRFGAGPTLEAGYNWNWQVLEFKLFLGGSGKIEFLLPRPSTTLSGLRADRFIFTGEAGYEARILWFSKEHKGQLSWTYPPQASSTALNVLNVTETDWGLIAHPDTPNYASFQARPGTLQAFGATGASLQGVGVTRNAITPLVTSVYTYTEPTLALNPTTDNAMLLWVHDDIRKPVGQSHELNFSRWNGTAWSAPSAVTNDTVVDGNPQVAWDAAGNAVAVWSRMSEALPTTATWDEQTAKKLEIATATYNAATGVWSPPSLLTNNAALDMTPRLARGPGGELTAVWRQNSGGLLSGDLANPDRILVAQQSQGTWLTPTVAVDNLLGLADLSLGSGTNTAMLAFTRFVTATGAPSPTLQLFTSTLTAGSWSQPTQFTNDQLGHRSPQIIYNAANQPLLIWLAGGEVRLHNMTTGTTRALPVPAEVGGIDELRIVQDATGNIAAIFTAQTGQRDLYVAFYDEATALWGQPRHLTDNRDRESYPATALDSSGRLLMAYASTGVTLQERTVIDPATSQPITYTLAVEGQTDLMTLSKTFERNLTITNTQLTLSNDQPHAGDVVRLSATISNTGDLPVSPVSVQFFDGNPTSGGTALGTATGTQPLAGGTATTFSIDYTVPSNGGAREIYAVVDPTAVITESNEADNTAWLRAFGPDLTVTTTEVEPWTGTLVGLTSVLQNNGTTAAPPSTLTYLRETTTGSVLVSEPVPALAVGEVITLTTPFDYGSLPAGDYTTLALRRRK